MTQEMDPYTQLIGNLNKRFENFLKIKCNFINIKKLCKKLFEPISDCKILKMYISDPSLHGTWALANARYFLFPKEKLDVRIIYDFMKYFSFHRVYILRKILRINKFVFVVGVCFQKVLRPGHEVGQLGHQPQVRVLAHSGVK